MKVQNLCSNYELIVLTLKVYIAQWVLCWCRDGRSRAGVYCAANACIEQVIQHGEVDVFQAVKTVRRHRPQLVENMVSLRQSSFKIHY